MMLFSTSTPDLRLNEPGRFFCQDPSFLHCCNPKRVTELIGVSRLPLIQVSRLNCSHSNCSFNNQSSVSDRLPLWGVEVTTNRFAMHESPPSLRLGDLVPLGCEIGCLQSCVAGRSIPLPFRPSCLWLPGIDLSQLPASKSAYKQGGH